MRTGLEPDFVVTDRLMAGMTGIDHTGALAAERPDLGVLTV